MPGQARICHIAIDDQATEMELTSWFMLITVHFSSDWQDLTVK